MFEPLRKDLEAEVRADNTYSSLEWRVSKAARPAITWFPSVMLNNRWA
jgi:hypothetical protein